jgi:hypothetical protein
MPVPAVGVDSLLLDLAVGTELVQRDGDSLIPGEDVEWLDDLSEGTAALDAWEYAFALVLDLAGHGIATVMELFLGARTGVPVRQLSESLKIDPADLLLGQLEKLSAVTVTGEMARLEPLALHSIAARLRACDVQVPDHRRAR